MVAVAGSGGVERVVVMGWYSSACGWKERGGLLIGGGFVYPFPRCCCKCNVATTGVEYRCLDTTLSDLTRSVTMPLRKEKKKHEALHATQSTLSRLTCAR